MKNQIKDLGSFAKQIVARLKGDDADVMAQKNERKARAAFNQQISSLENRIVDAEGKVEDAEENFDKCLYPTELIESTSNYIARLAQAKNDVDKAKQELEDLNSSLEFYKNILEDKFN